MTFSSEIENFKRKLEIFKRSSEIGFFQDSGPLGIRKWPRSLFLRDGETTTKIKFAFFEGAGVGGREENCPQTLFFFGGGESP